MSVTFSQAPIADGPTSLLYRLHAVSLTRRFFISCEPCTPRLCKAHIPRRRPQNRLENPSATFNPYDLTADNQPFLHYDR